MGSSSNDGRGRDVAGRSARERHRGAARRGPLAILSALPFALGLTVAPRVYAQETLDAPEPNPDAPLAGAWKLRLDAPLLVIRNTSARVEGQKFEYSASNFGIPAGAGSFQLGYAVTSATNLGLNLGWSQSEAKIAMPGASQEAIETKLSQYRLGLYGEHLFLTNGIVHPSLGVLGELLGGTSGGQDASGLGLGLNGGLQIFIGNHASFDVNVRGEWVSSTVGDTTTTGFEFAGGLGLALWLGGETLSPDSSDDTSASFGRPSTSDAPRADAAPAAAPSNETSSDRATVQFSGGVTLTVEGTVEEPTFKLIVRGPSGECGPVELTMGERVETLEATPHKVEFGSQEAFVYSGHLTTHSLERMARASATTLVQIAVCGDTHQAGVFARQPLNEFLAGASSE